MKQDNKLLKEKFMDKGNCKLGFDLHQYNLKLKLTAIALAFLLFFSQMIYFPQEALAAQPSVVLSGVKGEVLVKKGGGLRELPAVNGMELVQGDWLRTGKSGTAKLSYEDGTEATIGSNSSLNIQRLTKSDSAEVSALSEARVTFSENGQQSSLKLWSGSVWNKVKSLFNMDDSYEVETPTAVMGVRGTLYLVSVNPENGATQGDVIEGVVGVTQNNEATQAAPIQLVTMGQTLRLVSSYEPLPEHQVIDPKELIRSTQAEILVQLINDIMERASELTVLTQEQQAAYEQTKVVDHLKAAIGTSFKVDELAGFGKEFVTSLKTSEKLDEVKRVLKDNNQSIEGLQSSIDRMKKETEEIRSEAIEAAEEAGVSEEEIESLEREAAGIPPTPDSVTPPTQPDPPTPPNTGSKKGGNSNNDGITPSPIGTPVPISKGVPVTFSNGVNVDFGDLNIPSGATITAREVSTENLPEGTIVKGKVIDFELSGMTLNGSATLTLPMSSDADPEKVGIFYLNGSKWDYQNSTVLNGKVVAEVSHFSTYGVLAYSLPSVPVMAEELLTAPPSPGSVTGATQFPTAPILPSGATKFLIKVQATPFSPPNLDDVFVGDDYTIGEDIPASVGDYIVLAAVDEADRIKAYYTTKLTSAMLLGSSGPETKIRIESIDLVSVNSDGIQGDDTSSEASISGDGQKVVFISYADNLVPDAHTSTQNIYVHNRQTGVTEQVNVNSQEVKVPGAMMPIISDNGRYVAFRSSRSGLVPDDLNGDDDIFVRDLDEGTTVRVSVSTNGTEAKYGNFGPGWPSISADGRYVAFSSDDETLVEGDDIQDIFVRDRDTDEDGIFDEPEAVSTSRVNISSEGQSANADCYFPVISADGRFVAFHSGATNLVPGITGDGIFVRDLKGNKTVYIANGMYPDLSDNGRYIVFQSNDSAQLVPGDTNQKGDLFVMDRDSDGNGIFDEEGNTSIERITLSDNGEQVDDDCYSPKISSDGRYVVYDTGATNLVPNAANGQDNIYLFDRFTRVTKLLSVSKTGWPANDYSGSPSISSDGKYISFGSSATNLVLDDTNGKGHVYVLDLDLNSPIDTDPPTFSTGSGLEAQEIGPSWVKLVWTEASDNIGVSSYSIYRGVNSEGPFTKIATLDSSSLSYWDTDLSPDSNYYYYVLAGDEDGNWSDVPTATLVKTIPDPAIVPKVVPIAAGSNHSLARTEDGLVWAWGDNSYGQLGDNTDEERLTPVQVLGPGGVGYLTDVAAVAAQCFGDGSMALKTDGTVWTWGDNDMGLLGIGHNDEYALTPVQVKGYNGEGYLTGVVEISTSMYHSFALKSDGTVWAWGDNSEGELGDGTDIDSFTPVPVKGPDGTGYLTGIIAIAAGDMHSVALKEDGTVWTWGQNSYAQLGNGVIDYNIHSLPCQVPGLSGVVAIAAGPYHTLVLKSDGTVWAWGYNYNGQLGNQTRSNSASPVQVLGENGSGYLDGITSIAAGNDFSLAIRDDQSVWAWGYNSYGQLGRPVVNPYCITTPVQSDDLKNIIHVAGGEEHSLAVDSYGSVWGLGYNHYGQLGIGTDDWDEHPTPEQVIGLNVAVDKTSPFVSSIDPNEEAIGVNIKKAICIVFNEVVYPGDNFSNISLVDNTNNPIDINKEIQGKTLILEPITNLAYSKTYSVNIPTDALKDFVGNSLGEDYSYSFTTEDQDLELPAWPEGSTLTAPIVSTSSISLKWEEAIDNNGINSYKLYMDGNPLESVSGDELAYTVEELTADRSYTFKVEAEDLQGNLSTTGPSITVSTSKELINEIADVTSGAGRYSSIAVDSLGMPHISYQDNNSGDPNLKYAYKNGDNWLTETVDSAGDVGLYSSLALDADGLPHISYRKNNSLDVGLKYAHFNGTDWEIEDVNNVAAEFTSIKVDASGSPHIIFNNSNGTAMVKHAYMSGDTWITEDIDVGMYASMAIDDDNTPHISYYDQANTALKYAYKDESGWQKMTVDSSDSVGAVTSLALDSNGNPHISYLDYTNKQIKYAYKDDFGWHIEKVGAAGTEGYSTSLAIDPSGKVYVTYVRYNGYDHPLFYAYKDSAGWHNVIAHDGYTKYFIEARPSIAVDTSGNMHMSYYSSGLEYIREVINF